jgi:signal transduction histidine kinase
MMIDLRFEHDDVRRSPMHVLRGALLPFACGLLQSVSVGTGLPEPAPGAAVVAGLVGLASGLALFARARAPVPVLAATVVGYVAQTLVGGPALPVAVCVILFVVARGPSADEQRQGHPPAWTAVALPAGLAGVIAPLIATGFEAEAALYGLLCSVSGAAGLLMALKGGREEQRRTELVMAERLRIARDLHDVVGHGLGAITMQAGAARMAVAAGALDDATGSLLDIEAAGRGVLQEVRWLVTLLREDERHPALLDVPTLVGNARRSGLSVDLDVDGDLTRVPARVGEAAYRIVQEALTNVLRHAEAKEAVVSIRLADTLDLDVVDRSTTHGSPPEVEEGNGLRGMRERAAAAGGVLSAGRRPDGGWSVHAELPVGRAS